METKKILVQKHSLSMRYLRDCLLQNIHFEQYFYRVIDAFLTILMCIHVIVLSTGSVQYGQEKNCLCQQEIIQSIRFHFQWKSYFSAFHTASGV